MCVSQVTLYSCFSKIRHRGCTLHTSFLHLSHFMSSRLYEISTPYILDFLHSRLPKFLTLDTFNLLSYQLFNCGLIDLSIFWTPDSFYSYGLTPYGPNITSWVRLVDLFVSLFRGPILSVSLLKCIWTSFIFNKIIFFINGFNEGEIGMIK